MDYILWGVNLPTLQMMLYDAPHYVQGTKARKGEGAKGKKPQAGKKTDIAALFQSRLNDY